MLVGATREDLIRELELVPLPVEGGMFCQTYKDEYSTVDLAAGQRPQVVVSAGTWQGTETLGDWTLLGTTMAPGYTEECFELGDRRDLVKQYPAAGKRIERLTRNAAS